MSLESQESIGTTDDSNREDDVVNTKLPAMRIMKLNLIKLKSEPEPEPGGSEDTDTSRVPEESVESMELEDVSEEVNASEITATSAEEYVQKLIDVSRRKYVVENRIVRDSLNTTMKNLHGHFSVKIVCHRQNTNSEMSRIIKTFEDGVDAPNPIEHENFIIFLMRELRAKESNPLLKYAEIFALTSGSAYNLIPKENRDEDFPRKIARRVLAFNLRSLSSKQLTGATSSKARTYREDEGTVPTFWDYLGQITTTYKMSPRSDSCLYRLPCFQTMTGKPKKFFMTVGEDFLRVHQKMSLKGMAALLLQLSRICRGQTSFKYMKAESEDDNPDFDVFDHVTIMKGKQFAKKQDEKLKEKLQSCLVTKQNVGMLLSHKRLENWHEANEFTLQAKSSEKRSHDTLEVWHGSPPSIEAIFDVIRSQSSAYELDRLFLEFQDSSKGKSEKIKDSLLMFLEGHFDTRDGMSLFRYCGMWLKIENEYMTHLEKEFNDIVVNCNVDANWILPLPWPFSGIDAPETIRVKDKKKTQRQSLPTTRDKFKKWYKDVYEINLKWESKDIPSDNVAFDKYPETEVKNKQALQLFYRLHCHQAEEHYNEGYIWQDRILDTNESGYLLGDRIFMKNVELYDILYYTQDKAYLIHVKEGFGNTTRDACSQIRISADLVFRDFICNNSFDILEEFWKTITTYESVSEEKESKYRCTVRDRYLKLTKEAFLNLFRRKNIIYVLAVRDSRKFKRRSEVLCVLYPEEKLKKTFGVDARNITDELLRCKYLKQSGEQIMITDKVINKTLKEAEQEINLPSVAKSREVFRILKQTISKHKSFIAKMEVVHLFSHFKRFRTPSQSLSLKLCFLDKTLPGN